MRYFEKSVQTRRGFKAILMACILSLVAGMFTACSTTGSKDSSTSKTQTKSKTLKIGIIQFMEHPSLDTIRQSFINELEAQGYKDGDNIKIDYQNGQGEQNNLKTISQKFVNNKYDLIVAIATPAAQAVAGETKKIPVLFAACTDPISAGLVKSLDKPGANISGTSDAVSAKEIIALAKRITPDIKTIGALYNAGEANSVSVIKDLKSYAKQNGLKVVEGTVTNTSEVMQVAQTLTGKADALFSPIDNTVASAMSVVAKVANAAKKPVYVGADSMVKDGGLATYGVNYEILGQETAVMAVKILKGRRPAVIPVRTFDIPEMQIYLNQATADKIGVTFPDDVVKEAKQVFGNKK